MQIETVKWGGTAYQRADVLWRQKQFQSAKHLCTFYSVKRQLDSEIGFFLGEFETLLRSWLSKNIRVDFSKRQKRKKNINKITAKSFKRE